MRVVLPGRRQVWPDTNQAIVIAVAMAIAVAVAVVVTPPSAKAASPWTAVPVGKYEATFRSETRFVQVEGDRTTKTSPDVANHRTLAVGKSDRTKKKKAKRTRLGRLIVSVLPWGKCQINGVPHITPLSVALRAGRYTIVCGKPSYKSVRRRVKVRAGKTTRLTIQLVPEGTTED